MILATIRDRVKRFQSASELALRESRQISEIAQEIRATDPYYEGKSDLRIQLDAMKRWRMIIAQGRRDAEPHA